MKHKIEISTIRVLAGLVLTCGMVSAQAPQAPNPTQESNAVVDSGHMAVGAVPIYRVTVVARTMKAINYNHRSGATNIGFRGTTLMPEARGEARVESKQGVIKIDATMQKLDAATKFGSEYLTYVMWAITPEGRATNVGEVLLNGHRSKLNATTELQSFGLIITAEPYFAVTQPSDVVVMENFVRHDTTGTIEEVDAKYELLQRGQYVLNVNPSEIRPRKLDKKVPLELYEARNAVQIARWTGAPRYAADSFKKAEIGLLNAEGYLIGKGGNKPIGTVAREAVQMAEDSRIITIKKMGEEELGNERQAGMQREATAETARANAQSEAERIAREAETARVASQTEAQRVAREHDAQTAASQAEMDRVKHEHEAQALAAQAEADRLKKDSDSRVAAAQSETDRQKLDNDARTASAQVEADRLKRENDARMAAAQTAAQTEADRLKRENDAHMAVAQASLDKAAAEKVQAEAEKAQLRAQLLVQFNAILQTRDTARGLIVNMSDVLFDTAKFSLRPGAREKLARVAGILAGHPGLRMEVEGYTDSVGTDIYNQQLSENRATSVRDYLTQAGIAGDSVTAKGFGKTLPVATNETAVGRQQNRRVELIVSGELIGGNVMPTPIVAAK